ncbi:YggS family pyridoxal phosphate-dependent enzyme [Synechocystis sp. PCC 7509]|uniref:YggS family pyridoxal phosphate-dependent enzyme n=1 Tax=Synechocystis sp. PCC 7509 TaxID=927677 RepID=UPI0002AC0C4C|nr:YggS family pyridoxal phosphate-dependent enzyme [Synechocystis sp. PCC 7509]
MTIAARITQIRQNLPDSVKLIAVSKQVSVEAMRIAYGAGIRDFGESRVQEAEAKQEQLADLTDITWHFIGRLQSNKAKKALELFAWIHSVDSLKLAQQLDKLVQENHYQPPKVCLQVKIESDPQKTGWTIPQLWVDLPDLDRCKNLQIRGLMTIPPLGLNENEIKSVFDRTKILLKEIQTKNCLHLQPTLQLSMGMSDDYQIAIASGSTMIRLGKILFGERS